MSNRTRTPRKRSRGAQPGNYNALRHGLYSRHLDAAALAAFQAAQTLKPDELTAELALARARLDALIKAGGLTHQDVDLAIHRVMKVAAAVHRLTPQNSASLLDRVGAVVENLSLSFGLTATEPAADAIVDDARKRLR